jgi:hypothetical protein
MKLGRLIAVLGLGVALGTGGCSKSGGEATSETANQTKSPEPAKAAQASTPKAVKGKVMAPTDENMEKFGAAVKEIAKNLTAREEDLGKSDTEEGKKFALKKVIVEPFEMCGFDLDATLKDYSTRMKDGNYTRDQGQVMTMVYMLCSEKIDDLVTYGFVQGGTRDMFKAAFKTTNQ